MKLIQGFILITLSLLFFSCTENNAQKTKNKDSLNIANTDVFTDHILDSASTGLVFKPTGNYNVIKSSISQKREQFKKAYLASIDSFERAVILDSARFFFTNSLLNELIPHWYGTVWDFNGYTNVPNSGVIACGYFISTTLKHLGVNMNRYRFAQQAGMNEAKTLDPDHNYRLIRIHHSEAIDSVVNVIEEEFRPGLYALGLSNHVGYIYIKDKTAYFIHSNYIDGHVMTEKARYSDAFWSSIYVFTDLTYNDFLIESWILNKEIVVITE